MTAAPETMVTTIRGWDWQRILYGDWTWLVRDWIDVIRLAFIGGTIAFAVQGRSDVIALTAASSVLLIARIIDLPRWFDFGLTVAMTLIAWGTALHLYGQWFYYDKVVHGLSPVAYAPVLYIVLVRLGVVPDPGEAIRERRTARISGIFIVTLALGMAVGAGYESVEWFEDKLDILGGNFVKGLWDTETDLLADTSGSLVGATFLTVWAMHGWSSRRVTVVPAPGPSSTALEAAAERLRTGHSSAPKSRLAGLPLAAQGFVAVVGGLLLLALPSPSLRTLGIVFGIVLLVFAAFEAVELVRGGSGAERAGRLATIAASAVAGTLALAWPTISQYALLYAAGAASVVFAFAEVASLSTTLDAHERWLGALAGLAAFVFGVALLASPGKSLQAVITLVGVYLLVLGGLRLVRAAEAWRERRASGV
jgi:uncharacterized membrane protein HdeD (DUF308 family)/uncharacterized membrane protein YjdF